MAPSRKEKINRTTPRSQVRKQSEATSKVVQQYVIPIQFQQAILNVFTHALPINNHDFRTILQEVKGHLYNRDFETAFGKSEYLYAYALRWSAARALAYSHIFTRPERHTWFLPADSKEQYAAPAGSIAELANDDARRLPTKIACIGGGAGAEIVALAASSRIMNLSQPLEVYAIDKADWAEPAARLLTALTMPLSLSPYASDAVKAANRAFIDPGKILVHFCHRDVLDSCSSPTTTNAASREEQQPKPMTEATTTTTVTTLPTTTTTSAVPNGAQQTPISAKTADNQKDLSLFSILSTVTLCTMMFTLNELFSTSVAKTTAMLLSLTDAMQPQSRLVVVDSPGSYSEIVLGRQDKSTNDGGTQPHGPTQTKKKYPMKWLLDHTLLDMSGPQKWKKVEAEDSVWFRIEDPGKTLKYPVELENCRYQIHVYQRL